MHIDFTFSLCTRFLHTRWPTGQGFSLTWTGIVPTFYSILFFYLFCRFPTSYRKRHCLVLDFRTCGIRGLNSDIQVPKFKYSQICQFELHLVLSVFKMVPFMASNICWFQIFEKLPMIQKFKIWPVSKVCSENFDGLISLLFFDAMVIFAELILVFLVGASVKKCPLIRWLFLVGAFKMRECPIISVAFCLFLVF